MAILSAGRGAPRPAEQGNAATRTSRLRLSLPAPTNRHPAGVRRRPSRAGTGWGWSTSGAP